MATVVVIVIFAAFIFAKAVIIVPGDQVYIRTRLGKLQGAMRPGLHFLVPFIDSVSACYPSKEQSVAISDTFVSSDEESVAVELDARYRVLDAVKAFQNITDVDHAIRALLVATIKKEVERRKGDDFRSERGSIESDLTRSVNEAASQFGVYVTGCTLR